MSKSIKNAMYYAWMSQASYLDLQKTANETFNKDLVKSKYAPNNIFSSAQAEIFVDHYDFVHHLPNTYSGTSATVFQNKADKSYTIAIRGTEAKLNDLCDLFTDFNGVVVEGKAKTQVIQAFQYYKQLTTAKEEAVEYTAQEKTALLKFVFSDGLNTSISLEKQTIIAEYLINKLSEDKGLGIMTDAQTINFTGHSLGGHVAYLFAGLVAESQNTIAVGDVMTYNSPGEGSLFYELINWIKPGTVISQEGEIGSKHLLFYGNEGVEVTALAGKVIGTPVATYIEGSINPIYNHSIVKMSDSLAIYQLLASIDTDSSNKTAIANIDKFTQVLKIAANEDNKTLENIVNALDKLYFGKEAKTVPIDDRGALYERILALQETIGTNSTTKVITDIGEIIKQASEVVGTAARYALKMLNPFAIVSDALYGKEGVLKDMLPELV